jgi:glycosyltransferase involved in cell wall biosynthesis
MRALHILIGMVDPSLPGGIWVTETKTIEEFRRRGMTVTLFEFGSRSLKESRFQKVVGRTRDVVRYVGLLVRRKPDIVFVNSSFTVNGILRDCAYALASHLLRRPLFIKLHGADTRLLDSGSAFLRVFIRITMRYAAAVGLLSSEEKKSFVAKGYPPGKFFIIKNAVDADRFAGGPYSARSPYPLLFISRLVSTKGLPDVLRAVRLVRDRGKDVRLWCVGDGPQRAEAELLAAELGLTGIVTFTGQIPESEATRYYKNASMLVFPTFHKEGFSMALFQAVAAGLPVVTTRIRAAADYLKEPDNVLWVEPHNPAMLADKILFLLDHPETAAAISRNNYARAREFTAEKVAPEYLEIFEEVITNYRSRYRP